MPELVRPSYLEELPPTQRLTDSVPALPATAPVITLPAPAPPPEVLPAEPSGAVAAASGPGDPLTQPTVEPADAQTVKRTGRITSPVHVVQRLGGTAVSFSLAETDAAGHTSIHRVYATKQFAERLTKHQLQQGMLVEVAGQPQLRRETQPDGSTRQLPYVYCFGIRILAPEA